MADDNRTYVLFALGANDVLSRASVLDAKEAAIQRTYGIAEGERLLPLAAGVEHEGRKITALDLSADETEIDGLTYAEPLTGLVKAGIGLFQQFDVWADQLNRYARGQRIAHVNKGHDFLFFGRQSGFLVLNDAVTTAGWQNLTAAERIAWAESMGQGALDTTNAQEYYGKAGGLDAPTTPVSWVTRAGARVNLSNGIELAGDIPAGTDLVNPAAWLKDLI